MALSQHLEFNISDTYLKSEEPLEETEDIARFVLDISEEWDVTIILIEHDMGVVMDISDRVCVLDFGRKIAEDAPMKIRHNEHVIKAYLGEEDKTYSRLDA